MRRDATPPPATAPGRRSRPGPAPRSGADLTLWAGLVYIVGVIAVTVAAGKLWLGVWLLGFWHYLIYWFAWRYGVVAHGIFKRDALLTKSTALGAFLAVYVTAPLHLGSIAVMAAGFGLNLLAAHVMGVDRTYYGREVAGLPPARITAFPFSLVRHPMLTGNIVGFAGALLNPAFREQWWALALAHVVMNVGLLLMETQVVPGRFRASEDAAPVPAGRALGAVLLFILGATLVAAGLAVVARRDLAELMGLCAIAGVVAYGCVLAFVYTTPRAS